MKTLGQKLIHVHRDYTREEELWQAVKKRDPRYYSQFVYGVNSTKIFCRPTCPSKKPKTREGVAFFPDSASAKRAGFRPCQTLQTRGPFRESGHRRRHQAEDDNQRQANPRHLVFDAIMHQIEDMNGKRLHAGRHHEIAGREIAQGQGQADQPGDRQGAPPLRQDNVPELPQRTAALRRRAVQHRLGDGSHGIPQHQHRRPQCPDRRGPARGQESSGRKARSGRELAGCSAAR